MSFRTQKEVDAMWPKDKEVYIIDGLVRFSYHLTSLETAAENVQVLYNEGVAGRFKIKDLIAESRNETAFKIEFFRDICDDKEIVNFELRRGTSFKLALSAQIHKELDEVIIKNGYDIEFIVFNSVRFK